MTRFTTILVCVLFKSLLISACQPKQKPEPKQADSVEVDLDKTASPTQDSVQLEATEETATPAKAIFDKHALKQFKGGQVGSGSPLRQSAERSTIEGPGGGSPLSPSVEKGGFSAHGDVNPAGPAPDDSPSPSSDSEPETE